MVCEANNFLSSKGCSTSDIDLFVRKDCAFSSTEFDFSVFCYCIVLCECTRNLAIPSSDIFDQVSDICIAARCYSGMKKCWCKDLAELCKQGWNSNLVAELSLSWKISHVIACTIWQGFIVHTGLNTSKRITQSASYFCSTLWWYFVLYIIKIKVVKGTSWWY